MAHQALVLKPGVDQNQTPALNEAAISNSQLVRFIPDPSSGAIVQQLGGWTSFTSNTIGSTTRCLCAWSDVNNNIYLAAGADQALKVIVGWQSLSSTGSMIDITPQAGTYSATPVFTTTSGSSTVTITTGVSVTVTSFDSVFIQTPVAVDNLLLYGLYQCTSVSGGTQYTITATDALGNPLVAVAGVTGGGAVPQYVTAAGSSLITVNLANTNLSIGSTYTAYVSTLIGGITVKGEYQVVAVNSSSQFVIQSNTTASSTATAYINGGLASFEYFFSPGYASGYGVGGYGLGGYGTSAVTLPAGGSAITATDWTLDNWGSILISNPLNGPIYEWNPVQGQLLATVISQAPVANAGIFVAMPQRQIIAWGSTFDGIVDPLLIRWCDVNNFSLWIAQSTNHAGSYRLTRGSQIIGALQAGQQAFIWTDVGVWSMSYIGQPYIYGFNEVSTGCGLIGRKAAAALGADVYWMSQSQFFVMSSQGPTPITCPVWDVVFQNIDTSNANNIRAAVNSRFGEVTWYYPTIGSNGINTNYVKYNANLQVWDYGVLGRTAWLNQSVFGPPIGCGTDNNLYQHETSTLAGTSPLISNFTTGYFAISEGDEKCLIDEVWPDFKWGYNGGTQNAIMNITFNIVDFPGQTPTTFGPYPVTKSTTYLTPRMRGRLMSITIANDPGSQDFWRLGKIRYRVTPDGKY